MLRRECERLPQENVTCLPVTVQNAVSNLNHMLDLVKDPWANSTLLKILHGDQVNDLEGYFLISIISYIVIFPY